MTIPLYSSQDAESLKHVVTMLDGIGAVLDEMKKIVAADPKAINLDEMKAVYVGLRAISGAMVSTIRKLDDLAMWLRVEAIKAHNFDIATDEKL